MTTKTDIVNLKTEAMKRNAVARKNGDSNDELVEIIAVYNEVLTAVTDAEVKRVKVNKNDTEADSGRVELSEKEILAVITQVKKSIDKVVEEYTAKGVRAEDIERLKIRSNTLASMLPAELGEQEVRDLVVNLVNNGVNTIPGIMKELKGTEGVNMGLASKIARELVG